MNEPQSVLPYATPDHRRSYWPAAILCATGLGLIVLGGCFTIGILLLTEVPSGWAQRHVMLALVLYGCCGGCFAGAVAVLRMGIRLALK